MTSSPPDAFSVNEEPGPAAYRRLALDLARGELTAGGQLRLWVNGDSMAPVLKPGDAVLVEPARPLDLRTGDLVAVRRASQVVTHRVVGRQADGSWLVKADNRRRPDPPALPEQVLGRAVVRERGGRVRRLDGPAARLMGRLSGWEGRIYERLAPAGHPPAGARLAFLVSLPSAFVRWFLRDS